MHWKVYKTYSSIDVYVSSLKNFLNFCQISVSASHMQSRFSFEGKSLKAFKWKVFYKSFLPYLLRFTPLDFSMSDKLVWFSNSWELGDSCWKWDDETKS